MYTKVFRTIFDGSLYGKFEPTVTFLGFLILADKNGDVDLTPEKIAAETGFPLDLIQKGIEELSKPDGRSRTPDEDGRRIVLLDDHRDWGWRITNFEKYNSIRNQQERAEYFRQYRKRKQKTLRATSATTGNHGQPAKTPPDSYTDTDVDTVRKELSIEPKGSTSIPQATTRVFEHWKTVHQHPKAQLDEKRQRLITKALKVYREEDLCMSLTGYLNSPHHMGQNDRATVYNAIELLLKDAQHIDAGLKFYQSPPVTHLSRKTREMVAQTEEWQPPESRHAAD